MRKHIIRNAAVARWLALCIGALTLAGCSGHVQLHPAFELVDQSRQGNLPENASPLFRSALNQARQVDVDGTLQVRLLNAFGEYQLRKGALDGAEKTFGEAWALAKRSKAVTEAEKARAAEGIGNALVAQRRDREALEYIRQSIGMYTAAYGEQSRTLAREVGLLGDVHYRLGDFKGAESAYNRALRILCSCDGSRLGDEAGCAMRALGRCLIAQGREKEAKPLMRQSFEILRKMHAKSPRYSAL